MTEIEAVEFVARLVAAYPGVKFTEQNARAYQGLLVNLEAGEAETARLELAETSKFIPSFAEIREVAMRNRKAVRARESAALRLPENNTAPTPSEWGACLARLLESSARHQRMVAAWCEKNGKPLPPGDPAQAYIDLARDGASGEDVRFRFKKTVIGGGADEAEELERRYP